MRNGGRPLKEVPNRLAIVAGMLAIEPLSKSGGTNSAGRFEINLKSIVTLGDDKRKDQGYTTLAFGVGVWNAADISIGRPLLLFNESASGLLNY